MRGDSAEASRRVASLRVVLLFRTTHMTLASLRSLSTSSSTLSTYTATGGRYGADRARGAIEGQLEGRADRDARLAFGRLLDGDGGEVLLEIDADVLERELVPARWERGRTRLRTARRPRRRSDAAAPELGRCAHFLLLGLHDVWQRRVPAFGGGFSDEAAWMTLVARAARCAWQRCIPWLI